MRQLKFRAWDGKEMHLPEVSDDTDFYLSCEGEARYTKEVGVEGHTIWLSRKDWVVMQYTGLKDKNGKEIYEGDILSFITSIEKGHGVDGVEACYIVVWDKVCFHGDTLYAQTGFLAKSVASDALMSIEYNTKYQGAIVIGNIYENPQLLSNSQ